MVDQISRAATACGSCAKAKVRCIRTEPLSRPARDDTDGWTTCDRCQRLKRSCSPQQVSQRATPLPRTRFGQLERKVDALMQTMAQRKSQLPTRSSQQLPTLDAVLKMEQSLTPESTNTVSDSTRQQPFPEPAHLPSPSENTDVFDGTLWPADDEAERLLSIYSEVLGTVFPFVVPPKENAATMRRDRPYLFKAMVMAATYKNRELQKQRATEFMTSLSLAVFLRGEKTLDMLQSLLVHIAWYQCHLQRNTQMTNLTQLAISLLADLELNKPYHANDRRKLIFDGSRSSWGFTTEAKILSNEERRVLLACYYFSSFGSTVYRKVDALLYTPHIDEALQSLIADNDNASDALLAQLVRLQTIVYEITQVVPYDEPNQPRCTGSAFLMHLKTLDRSLTEFKSSLPENLQKHDFLLMHLHTARIFLYEVSLYETPWQGAPARTRLDALRTCSNLIAAFFETFFLFPDEAFLILPYAIWAQLSHALLITSRLCLLDYKLWSTEFMDEEVRFCAVLDRVLAKVHRANNGAKRAWLGDKDDAILGRVISKLKWIKTWFENFTVPSFQDGNGEQMYDLEAGADPEAMAGVFIDSRFWDEIMSEFQAAPIASAPMANSNSFLN